MADMLFPSLIRREERSFPTLLPVLAVVLNGLMGIRIKSVWELAL